MAQLASASGLGPEGPVFESQYPDIEGNSLIFSGFLFCFSAFFSAKLFLGSFAKGDQVQKYVF